ncbi:MAG: DNA-protecting protein DprA [Ruminococcus sp.]|nr:DNA-protecting protein DprA [Ruminococcus sp.]
MNNKSKAKYWVWLTMIFGVANRRIWEAMRFFQHADEAYEALSSGMLGDRLDANELKNLKSIDIEKASQHIDMCEKAGISVTCYDDEEYPDQLRHILNPPAVLYYKGNIRCLKGARTVTSVGARRASDYALKATDKFCRELSKSGFVIVSGFAVGIDITSHMSAVSQQRPTVCVLGSGVDVDYPRENFRYREQILSTGGAFVSEFPPGTPPHSQNFPKRNRILSALGKVTVVFEASATSGSLLTARNSADQGREVFCLPPADIFAKNWEGNVSLLRDGALPLLSVNDVLDCFRIGGAIDKEIRNSLKLEKAVISDFGVRELSYRKVKEKTEKVKTEPEKKSKAKKKESSAEIQAFKAEPVDKKEPELDGLSEIQKKIAELLKGGALHADIISQTLELDSAILMTELTELEIEGVITALPGKMYELI